MRLNIKVIPKASRNEVIEEDNAFKVYVRAVPDKGKANKSVIELIAKHFGVKKKDVTLIAGLKNRNKVVEVSKDKG